MFPLLLYFPPLLGFDPITVKNITGLTMIQGFFASLSAMLFFSKERLVNKALALTLGLSLFFSSFVGAIFSKATSDEFLLFIFGILALSASVLMFIPRSYSKDDLTEDKVVFHKPIAVLTGIFIGFLLGMVGQGGAFIIIPILLYVLKIPSQGSSWKHTCYRAFFCDSRISRENHHRTGPILHGWCPPSWCNPISKIRRHSK